MNNTERRKDETIQEFEMRVSLNKDEYGLTWPEVAALLNKENGKNVGESSYRKYYIPFSDGVKYAKRLMAVENGAIKDINQTKSICINGDGSQISEGKFEVSDESNLRNSEYLLKLHNYDPLVWEVISSKSSFWEAQVKDEGIKTLYSSKITVKPKQSISLEYVRDSLVKAVKENKKSEIIPINIKQSDKLLEVNIADLHLGKLGWAGEVGENYDYKIASNRFKYIITDILEQVSNMNFEKIIFVWCNDFYHFDTIGATTQAGTPQDSDIRWQKMFQIGVDLLVWAIDVLSKKAPVETFYIASNHDTQTSFYCTNYLYAWYNDNPNVTVDTSAIGRKYREFGKVMLGYCHGGAEGKNINNLMSKEQPEMFGRTKFRYMHAGHFHSSQGKTIIEDGGCIVHYLGSPTGTDSWHYSKGYLGAIKCGYAFVYDKNLGQRIEIRSNIL